MKTTLMAICLFTAGLLACKIDNNPAPVPSVVQNTLKVAYQAARGIEWELKGNLYEAEFGIGQVDHAAFISPSGKFIMHKMDMQLTDLPQEVRKAVNQEFPGQVPDEVEKIEKEGATYYQVEMEGPLGDNQLVYTAQGVKTESIPYWD